VQAGDASPHGDPLQFVVAARRASQLHVSGSTHQNSLMWKIWQNPCGEPSPAISENRAPKKSRQH
jgi:hypothetical protein